MSLIRSGISCSCCSIIGSLSMSVTPYLPHLIAILYCARHCSCYWRLNLSIGRCSIFSSSIGFHPTESPRFSIAISLHPCRLSCSFFPMQFAFSLFQQNRHPKSTLQSNTILFLIWSGTRTNLFPPFRPAPSPSNTSGWC